MRFKSEVVTKIPSEQTNYWKSQHSFDPDSLDSLRTVAYGRSVKKRTQSSVFTLDRVLDRFGFLPYAGPNGHRTDCFWAELYLPSRRKT